MRLRFIACVPLLFACGGGSANEAGGTGAPEPLTATEGSSGCRVGDTCEWRSQVIAEHPEDSDACGEDCEAEGVGRMVGWVVRS